MLASVTSIVGLLGGKASRMILFCQREATVILGSITSKDSSRTFGSKIFFFFFKDV